MVVMDSRTLPGVLKLGRLLGRPASHDLADQTQQQPHQHGCPEK
jgi:hypothetical protein